MRDPAIATTLCSFCPKLCRYACPVADADANESTTPWGKMNALKFVEENKLPMDRKTMGLAYKCLNCRASKSACEMANPVSSVLDTYRVRAFRAGLAPDGVEEACKKFQKHNNPFEKDLQRALLRRFPAAAFKKQRAVYFPGCTEIAQSLPTVERVIEMLPGVSLYPEPIQCCGYPLFSAGDWNNFVELAEVNSHALREYDLVITGDPGCLYTMETLYRSAGHPAGTRFMHIVEFLAEKSPSIPLFQRGKSKRHPPLKKGGKGGFSVAYHDPCYLGRYRKGYDAPRRLIEAVTGRKPIEFPRNRESSYCCGAGGLLPVSFPETADKITTSRVEEFRQTGADLLVTTCPACVQRFRKFGVPAKGLIDYLYEK